MSVNLVTWNESLVTPLDDALVYHTAIENSGIIYGAEVSIKSSNVLHITSGHGILCGRKITIEEEDIAVVLPSSGNLNGRLYLHMDLSNTGDPIQLLTEIAATLTPEVQDENVNINLGVFETNICTFNAMPEGLTDLQMVAKEALSSGAVAEKLVAPIEKGSTFSRDYSAGSSFIYKNKIYRARLSIPRGSNIESIIQTSAADITVSMYLSEIDNMINYFMNQVRDIKKNIYDNFSAENMIALTSISAGTVFVNVNNRKEYEYFDSNDFFFDHNFYLAKTNIARGQRLSVPDNCEYISTFIDLFEILQSRIAEKLSISGGTLAGALTVNLQDGTASTVGTSSIIVGNNISQGVAKNSRGMIRIYGTNQNYVNLLVGNLTAYRNITFPDKAGTVAVYTGVTITGKNSFTVGNVSARVIGDLLIARFTLNCRTSAWTAGIVAASLNVTAAVAGAVPPEQGTSAPWLEIAANSGDLKAAAGTAGASAWYTLILVVK